MRYVPDPIMQPNDVTGINNNFSLIAAAILSLVSRSNDSPNMMLADFDMNGFDILNLGNPVTLASFNWRGNWVTSRLYNPGDAVFYNSSAYLCQLVNTSTTFIADLLAGKWTLIALGTKFQGDWVGPGTAYFVGDLVAILPDAFYYCLKDHISTGTFANDLAAGDWEVYEATLGTMALQNANAVNITGGTIQATLTGSITADPVSAMEPANKEYVDAAITNALANFGSPGSYQFCDGTPGSAWIPVNDGTVGNAASTATYANADATLLFAIWWAYAPALVPMFTSAGVYQARGASAAADFVANMKIMMPLRVGRALCVSGTATFNQIVSNVTGNILTIPTTASMYNGTPVQFSVTGGALPSPLAPSTTYYVLLLSATTFSVAISQNNVNAGTPITLTTTGSGTIQVAVQYTAYGPGVAIGEQAHQSVTSEMPAHNHTIQTDNASADASNTYQNSSDNGTDASIRGTSTTGGNVPHNNMQPSSFLPLYVHK